MAQIWILSDQRYLNQRMPLAIIQWLEGQGHAPRVVVTDGALRPGQLAPRELLTELRQNDAIAAASPWADLVPGDLVVTRTRHPFGLALLKDAEIRGARTCNTHGSIAHVQDKVACTLTLSHHEIPIPPTFVARRPEDLRHVPARLFPLLLKPAWGDNAQGLRMVRNPRELHAVVWPDELVLAQQFIDSNDLDLKIYGAGETVWMVRSPSPLSDPSSPAVAVPVTPELRDLGTACAGLFGLQLFGIDVLESPDGPVVIDVNDFPNYRAVEEAPGVIGRLVLEQLSPREVRRCAS